MATCQVEVRNIEGYNNVLMITIKDDGEEIKWIATYGRFFLGFNDKATVSKQLKDTKNTFNKPGRYKNFSEADKEQRFYEGLQVHAGGQPTSAHQLLPEGSTPQPNGMLHIFNFRKEVAPTLQATLDDGTQVTIPLYMLTPINTRSKKKAPAEEGVKDFPSKWPIQSIPAEKMKHYEELVIKQLRKFFDQQGKNTAITIPIGTESSSKHPFTRMALRIKSVSQASITSAHNNTFGYSVAGENYHYIPVTDNHRFSPEQTDALIAGVQNLINKKSETNHPLVYGHCAGGSGRTGVFLAVTAMMNAALTQGKDFPALSDITTFLTENGRSQLGHATKENGAYQYIDPKSFPDDKDLYNEEQKSLLKQARATQVSTLYYYILENAESAFSTPYSKWISDLKHSMQQAVTGLESGNVDPLKEALTRLYNMVNNENSPCSDKEKKLHLAGFLKSHDMIADNWPEYIHDTAKRGGLTSLSDAMARHISPIEQVNDKTLRKDNIVETLLKVPGKPDSPRDVFVELDDVLKPFGLKQEDLKMGKNPSDEVKTIREALIKHTPTTLHAPFYAGDPHKPKTNGNNR